MSVVASATLLTLLICRDRHVGYYEAVAVMHPTLEVERSDTNACYWTKEILSNEDFNEISYNETNDKQICMRVYMRDSSAALDKLSSAVKLAKEKCSASRVQSEVTTTPYIERTPSKRQFIRYAGLSLIFSIMIAGAAFVGWKIYKAK